MSEQPSIRDDIAMATHAWRDHAIDATPLGEHPICNCYDYADHLLASPVIRRIQAEALRCALADVSESEPTYGNASVWVYPSAESIRNYLRSEIDRIEKGE